MAMDANFHLVGLARRNNEAEAALWGGHGYLRKQEDLERHIEIHQPLLKEEICIRATGSV